ncbi:hypothetical protein KKHLCK_03060 [Candidatus Electrothrix laxa]
MKICITATGNDINAATDAAFGRAPWFVLVDTESGLTQGVENVSAEATQGAGIAAAQTMTEHGVDAVLTGRLGPKAKIALESSGIRMYEGVGRSTVAEALEQFHVGQYAASGQVQEQSTAGSVSPAADSSSVQFKGSGAVKAQEGCGCGKGKGQGRRRGR